MLFSNQMSILRSFHERFFLRWRQLGAPAPRLTSTPTRPSRDSKKQLFVHEIEDTEKMVEERLLSLDLISQELIQLVRPTAQFLMLEVTNLMQEFNLTSIAEAQKSTTMNRSMKRLSWITVGLIRPHSLNY